MNFELLLKQLFTLQLTGTFIFFTQLKYYFNSDDFSDYHCFNQIFMDHLEMKLDPYNQTFSIVFSVDRCKARDLFKNFIENGYNDNLPKI